MQCPKCGFNTNPGDQVCINCGNKLSFTNLEDKTNVESKVTFSQTKKINWKFLICTIIIFMVGILIALLIMYFMRKSL